MPRLGKGSGYFSQSLQFLEMSMILQTSLSPREIQENFSLHGVFWECIPFIKGSILSLNTGSYSETREVVPFHAPFLQGQSAYLVLGSPSTAGVSFACLPLRSPCKPSFPLGPLGWCQTYSKHPAQSAYEFPGAAVTKHHRLGG